MYVRGEAYLRLRDGAKAAAEYQKILDHRGIDSDQSALSSGPAGIWRAPMRCRETRRKPRQAYQDFFASWKDADPDVPILKEAKAEYAKLQ